MNELDGLPIVFGVTGHRDIPPTDVPALTSAVRSIFDGFRERYPSTQLRLLTPLAAGADRIVARAAIAAGIPIYVPMPFDEAEYRKDFDAAESAEFDELLAIAKSHFAVGFDGDNDAQNVVGDRTRRARQYALVGKYVAYNAHVLIALWDGSISGPVGGTANIVDYRLYGGPAPNGEQLSLLDAPQTGAVYHVLTAREGEDAQVLDGPVGSLVVKTRLGDVDPGHDPFAPLYARIERFNRDAEKLAPADRGKLRHVAEELATRYQRFYLLALNFISIATPLAAISLALAHTNFQEFPLALFYAGLALVAYGCYRISDENSWKDRSIDYRALEMALLVQHVWQAIGLEHQVANYYLRMQRSELEWIRDAARTNEIFREPLRADPERGVVVARDFISSQRAFFAKAAERDRKRCRRLEVITSCAIAVGAFFTATFIAISIAKFVGWTYPGFEGFLDGGETCIRGIVIATIVAAVSHEYSNRRAFHAQSRRYDSAFAIYDRAQEIVEDSDGRPLEERLLITRDVVFEVGKEALAESANWLMMQRELPVEMLHV
jgi:tetratricopeptide (TPR) repeat protein